ncbi:stage III sporulation protein AF [Romboutsia lituseburensis]|uniref:Stage III sporulation protein AF n=1 Tax=Romboutsia lituseburensis DSM 797 TaxID=1121325 RepID=A0A1G9Q900_9FIRM|nr:stage III sporulation protein AF [Romboutsia lituseburensis]CEH35401.1 Stage III sporulation protein AF (Spore_III_AF) [Romboutsia lituseburensis]SDM07562.1 stage III sporulation protein AF [Romboutsia lituseburensis DSM 797]
MLDNIKMWIVTILIGAFIVNIVDMILPSSKLKPYINLVVNFIFVFIVLTPIIGLFSKNISLEDTILKSIGKYNKEYVDSINELADKTGHNSLSKGYEDGLKEVLELKLGEYGYELKDMEFNGSDIENIKIKEKNSNKSEKEDIQSKEKENLKQAFKDKDQKEVKEEHELNLDSDKLKKDLVKILDVSIDDIEID